MADAPDPLSHKHLDQIISAERSISYATAARMARQIQAGMGPAKDKTPPPPPAPKKTAAPTSKPTPAVGPVDRKEEPAAKATPAVGAVTRKAPADKSPKNAVAVMGPPVDEVTAPAAAALKPEATAAKKSKALKS